jgi:hypothetical protein
MENKNWGDKTYGPCLQQSNKYESIVHLIN